MEDLRAELVRTTAENGCNLYDFIANHYWEMSKEDLKEVLLAVLGVCVDKCYGDEDEKALGELICNELECRFFGIDFDEEEDPQDETH